MGLRTFTLVTVLSAITCSEGVAQVVIDPNDSAILRAKANLANVERLVASGALPPVRLEQAKENLEDARDIAILHQTLYGRKLTPELSSEMMAAARPRVDRKRRGTPEMQKLRNQGIVSQSEMTAYLDDAERAAHELDWADSRAKLALQFTIMEGLQKHATEPLIPERKWSDGLGGQHQRALGVALESAMLFQRVSPSVYVVFAAPSREDPSNATQGSAVAVSEHRLLTNCHLVKGAELVELRHKGIVVEAKLFKADLDTDRCILEVVGRIVTPVPGVRDYSTLRVGEPVYSVGSPSGLENSFGPGLISGLRKMDGVNLVQTTAPISPGSSGGGLFDSRGNLIGITTFRLRDAQSLNFAIAADEYWR